MHNLNVKITSWARRKYTNLRLSEMKAIRWLNDISQINPILFGHWTKGAKPGIKRRVYRSRMNRDIHVRFCENLGLICPGAYSTML
ncbi:hypothetical protein SAMN04488057_12086 [Cyclobacterium lianum]|uniref:Uncharacterized protein n=1 Tax=Cyclobacterium lianum TaxID=388280 RepID=A0A1M7QN62_9BACT|nr:hypothetical protein SAMN04488057_12086 [Cyclobacterium lianum]